MTIGKIRAYEMGVDDARAVLLDRRRTPEQEQRFQEPVMRYGLHDEIKVIFYDPDHDERQPVRVPFYRLPLRNKLGDGAVTLHEWFTHPVHLAVRAHQRQCRVHRIHETHYAAGQGRPVAEHQIRRDADNGQYEQLEPIHACVSLDPAERLVPWFGPVVQPAIDYRDHHIDLFLGFHIAPRHCIIQRRLTDDGRWYVYIC